MCNIIAIVIKEMDGLSDIPMVICDYSTELETR